MAGQIETAWRDMDELLRLSMFSFAHDIEEARQSWKHVDAMHAQLAALDGVCPAW